MSISDDDLRRLLDRAASEEANRPAGEHLDDLARTRAQGARLTDEQRLRLVKACRREGVWAGDLAFYLVASEVMRIAERRAFDPTDRRDYDDVIFDAFVMHGEAEMAHLWANDREVFDERLSAGERAFDRST
jgi:hypothetical protein